MAFSTSQLNKSTFIKHFFINFLLFQQVPEGEAMQYYAMGKTYWTLDNVSLTGMMVCRRVYGCITIHPQVHELNHNMYVGRREKKS